MKVPTDVGGIEVCPPCSGAAETGWSSTYDKTREMEVREASCWKWSRALHERSIEAPEGGTSAKVIPPLFGVAEMPSVRVASAGRPSV